MGTRSTVSFYDNNEHLVTIYQQYDGYFSGVGKQLADFLSSKKLVNGISGDDTKVFNGAGCMAAQFIAAFKERAGGLYISNKDDRQEFNYSVKVKDNKIECIEFDGYDDNGDIEKKLSLPMFIKFIAKQK